MSLLKETEEARDKALEALAQRSNQLEEALHLATKLSDLVQDTIADVTDEKWRGRYWEMFNVLDIELGVLKVEAKK